ncbi:CBS domain-containing protein [Rhodococcus opacus]|uniref:CBS domain-containing protein n=1 Tax=Rhodococcus opacus TaxID=37919 RepID=UPI0024757990|nr:CBS domain-containing protein [Rhodococcus opacus]MDH6291901.1 CBS domain-containing protein [Rhodococcus opacus]
MDSPISRDPAREFLDLWSEIERHLHRKYSLSERVRGMGEILAEIRGRDALVRRYDPALTAFRDLRNAISHHRYRDGVPIATPRSETVDQLRRIHHELLDPLRIGQCLRAPAVVTAAPDEPLREALREMAEHTFSQLPVYENDKYLGLLTTNAVARWLAAQISDNGEVLVDQVRVREVLDFVEPNEKVAHLARTVSVAVVIDKFRKEDGAASLVAVIVSERGLPTQKPLGVVVRDDLAYLLERLPAVSL